MAVTAGLVEDLRAQTGRGQAVVIAGAGVALAASGGDENASWVGLLESALAWCERSLPGLPGTWPGLVRGLLDLGDASSFLSAADMLTDKLGGREGGEYGRWLHEMVGSLPLKDRAVPEALAGMGAPVGTTNYDDLIERVTGLAAVTWREGAAIERVLRGDERAVVHLHGHWHDPRSVVLGVRSYDQVLGDAAAQALLRAMATVRSLVFVGMGTGARDPNFAALRRWLAETFPDSPYRHFQSARPTSPWPRSTRPRS